MKPKYNFGDVVWWAQLEPIQKPIPCPDCCGKRCLTVVMGDGENVSIACQGCSSGYESPRGYIIKHEYVALIRSDTIRSIDPRDGSFRYGLGSPEATSYYCQDEEKLFSTELEAEAAKARLLEAMALEEDARIKAKHKEHRSWAWNAGYHRRQLKELQERTEWHARALDWASRLAKEKQP